MLRRIPDLLDWFAAVFARLFICCVTAGLLWCGGWAAYGDGHARSLLKKTVATIGSNWVVLLLVLLVLYYQPIRIFLEELQELYGAKRAIEENNPPRKAT